jgi:hypothetical protein
MLKSLRKYRFLLALIGLFSVSFGYVNISKNQLSNPVVQIEEVEFEEANLEGLADFGFEFFTSLFAILIASNFSTPINILLKRLKFEFIKQLAQSIQSVGHFLRFHQIKLGF